jgi:hypothetical protein
MSRISSPLLQSDVPGSTVYSELDAVARIKDGVADLQGRDSAERGQAPRASNSHDLLSVANEVIE